MERTSTAQIIFESRKIERSDAQLWENCVAGDEDAWQQLVDRFQRLTYSIPRRAGLNDEQCADVFQEVFLLLFQKLNEIEQPERIRAWIVTTTKFKTWAIVRASKGSYDPSSNEEMEAEMANLTDPSPLADEILVEMEQQHLIRTAIKMLEDRCQKVLSLLYLRDSPASYADAAKAIGVGETSISPLRSRCLKKLEKILSK